jgi:hypothetical protein
LLQLVLALTPTSANIVNNVAQKTPMKKQELRRRVESLALPQPDLVLCCHRQKTFHPFECEVMEVIEEEWFLVLGRYLLKLFFHCCPSPSKI